MPVYNVENFISEAIESILNQTLSNFEFIIIDDCSTDNTRGIIAKYKDPRLHFIKKNENTGLIESLNLGLNKAKGEFIARMDGDDISHITRFEKQVNFMRSNPEVVLCGTWYRTLTSNTIIIYPEEHERIKIAMLDYCPIGHPTVILRRDFFIKNKLNYDPTFKSAEDYDLWTRMAAKGKFANIPEVLLDYRLHSNQTTVKDKTNQDKNSILCRLRMMLYPLDNITEKDITMANLLLKEENICNINKLKGIVIWLDHCFNMNKKSAFYNIDEFKDYIKRKKTIIIRGYYLNQTNYNPKVFYQFLKEYKFFKDYLSTYEKLKFSLKCIILWKTVF